MYITAHLFPVGSSCTEQRSVHDVRGQKPVEGFQLTIPIGSLRNVRKLSGEIHHISWAKFEPGIPQ